MLWRQVTAFVVALAMSMGSVIGGTVFCPEDVTPWDFSAERGGLPGLPDDPAGVDTIGECDPTFELLPVLGLECTLALALPEPESVCAQAPPTPPPIAVGPTQLRS